MYILLNDSQIRELEIEEYNVYGIVVLDKMFFYRKQTSCIIETINNSDILKAITDKKLFISV